MRSLPHECGHAQSATLVSRSGREDCRLCEALTRGTTLEDRKAARYVHMAWRNAKSDTVEMGSNEGSERTRLLLLADAADLLASRLRGSPQDLACAVALTRFATFSGTGRRLAFGFGQTAVASEPLSWSKLLAVHLPMR